MRIIEKRTWCADDLRMTCIRERWYRSGEVEDYAAMLDAVDNSEPTTENIMAAAKNIIDHTLWLSDDDLTGVMAAILRTAVNIFYVDEGGDV
jgi:hypothetical protein